MHKPWIQLAQRIVKVKPSGFIDNNTHKAVDKYLKQKEVKPLIEKLPDINDRNFTIGYKFIAVIQIHATLKKITVGQVDGFPGPLTENAIDILLDNVFERSNETGKKFPSESKLTEFYGEVGKNQVRAQIPFEMMLAWDLHTKLTSFFCHEKVVKSVEKCYSRVLSHYGSSEISRLRLNRFAGCLNVRKKRGGTTMSTHSWGIAIDTNSQQNKLRWGKDRATLAKPEYDEWWKIWEDDGWLSMGRQSNFDWMHMQATRGK